MLYLKRDLISQDEIIPVCIFGGSSFEPKVMSISGFLQNLQPPNKDSHWEEQLGGIWAQIFYKISSEDIGDGNIN